MFAKRILTATILLVYTATTAVAQTTETEKFAFNLQQSIDYAIANNTRLQNAMLDEQIAAGKVNEIRGIGLPQISFGANLIDAEEIQTTFLPAKAFNPLAPPEQVTTVKFNVQYTSSASFSANQLLFSNSFLIGLQSAKTYQELLQKAATRTKIETAAAVSKAYYSVLVSEERLSLLDANVNRLKKLMDDTKALHDNGFVEKIDLDRITLLYNSLITEKEKVQRLVGLSSMLLKYQMGMNQSAALVLTDKLSTISFQPETIAEKPTYANRIEYSLAETQKHAAYLKYKNDKWSSLPTLAGFANVGVNTGGINFDLYSFDKPWFGYAMIGLNLSMPIFTGMQNHYKAQQSKIGMQKAENDLKFMQQSIDIEFANTSAQYQNASASLETQKKNVELAEEIIRVSKLKYDQGVGSNLEVLNAETSLKEAQTNYISALFDVLIAKIDYQKATGTLIK